MLYKRKKLKNGKDDPKAPYWVRFRHNNEEIRESTKTNNRKLAEEYEKQLRLACYEQGTLGRKVYVWQDAVDRWQRDAELRGKRSLKNDLGTKQWFDNILTDVRLDAITDQSIIEIRDALLEEPVRVGTKNERTRSPATVNRYLAFLRSVLNHARDKKMLDTVPAIESIKEKDFEPRILDDTESKKLLAELEKRAPHARAMAEFALETGLRWSNIAKLEWSAVRLEKPPAKSHVTVAASASKSKKAIPVPLSKRAAEILRDQDGQRETYVFYERVDSHGRVHPITSIKTAWNRATKAAGLSDVRFHDLRHTWATQQVAKGVPLAIVAKLGGWSSIRMLEDRYSHLRRDDLAAYVD